MARPAPNQPVSGLERELWRSESSPDAKAKVDTGLSMMWRARIAIAGAFLLALPALGIGLARTSEAVDASSAFAAAQNVFDAATRVENDIATGGLALVRFESEATPDLGRALVRRLDNVSRSTIALQQATGAALGFESLALVMRQWNFEANGERLLTDGERPLEILTDAIGRARTAIERQTRLKSGERLDLEAIERTEVALATADAFTRKFSASSLALTRQRGEAARASLAKAGRDLLVTFVILVLTFGAFLMFGPGFILAPVQRLRGLATRIESGRLREVSAQGFDEIADVSRSLQVALRRLEDNDHRKTRKILEMRKLLREVLAHTQDSILVLNCAGRVDYVNGPASKMVGQEAHNIEQAPLSDVLFSPGLSDVVELARDGDIPQAPVPVTIEIADGRVENLDAELGVIRSSDGDVSRIIVVMRKPNGEAEGRA